MPPKTVRRKEDYTDEDIENYRQLRVKDGSTFFSGLKKTEVLHEMMRFNWNPNPGPAKAQRIVLNKKQLLSLAKDADFDSISAEDMTYLCLAFGIPMEANFNKGKVSKFHHKECINQLQTKLREKVKSEGDNCLDGIDIVENGKRKKQEKKESKAAASTQQPAQQPDEQDDESEKEEGDPPVDPEPEMVEVSIKAPGLGKDLRKSIAMPVDSTVGDLLNQWAAETGQDANEFQLLTTDNIAVALDEILGEYTEEGQASFKLKPRLRGGAPKVINIEEVRESIRNAFTPDQQRAMDAEFRTLMAAEQLQATIARSDRLDSVITRQAEGALMSTSQYPRRSVIRGNATSHPAWLEGASIASLAKCNLPTLLTLAKCMDIEVAVEFDTRRNVWLKPKRDQVAQLVFMRAMAVLQELEHAQQAAAIQADGDDDDSGDDDNDDNDDED